MLRIHEARYCAVSVNSLPAGSGSGLLIDGSFTLCK